jgi:ABC-2 type transport system permease protein
VVEEKQSRVMELILNAATPFQLLTGKVLGVGAVAAIQYVAVIVTGAAAILLQGPLSGLLDGAGGSGGVSLPEGLTVGLMLLFGLYGVLGFLLYAVLFAAAGSLVSRQEDVSQITLPMTMVASLGYFVAVWAATGQLDARSGLVTVLSQIPFISPFLMLSRAATGEVATWEVALSVVLLFVAIAVSLWIASRIYAAGVLLYGQRPSLRKIWQIARSGS